MDTNRDSAHLSQNKHNFPTFSHGIEFLNEAEKEKNNGKKKLGISAVTIRSSLSEGKMQQILTERHSGKTKQTTNWSVSTFQDFKGKLKFYRLKLFNIKLELSTEKLKWNQSLFCLIFHLPRTITSDIVVRSVRVGFYAQCYRLCYIKQLVHAFSCALSSYGALRKFGEHSRS